MPRNMTPEELFSYGFYTCFGLTNDMRKSEPTCVKLQRPLVLQSLNRAVDRALERHGAIRVRRHLLKTGLDEIEGQADRARDQLDSNKGVTYLPTANNHNTHTLAM